MSNSKKNPHQINNKQVKWNSETESYDLVSDPAWDIETEFSLYNSLINQGLGDDFSAAVLGIFNAKRPVYPCYCHADHHLRGYTFTPCPCADCEIAAKSEGFNTLEPFDHISLHKNTVHVVGDMIFTNCIDQINDTLGGKLVITKEHFANFQFLLRQYGETEKTWTEVVDDFQTEDEQFWYSLSILENFWIIFVLTNPVISGHQPNDSKE
jgi:hypothetical protein